ncbi:hypothetical protein AAULR_09095 [Lacticaseibacillus rhamnosus MTCC 5462]|nr:hypothetical protein AAULR_09095 [Lacticaseibacillus rhamnosus MTCC 5462]
MPVETDSGLREQNDGILKAVKWKMFPRKFSGSGLSSAGHQWQSAD